MADPTPADRSYPKPVPLVPFPDRGRDVASLPASLSSFVGRALEVAAVAALLRGEDARLVTLSGPGGVGKTRLALRVAADLAAEFADGAAFVDLSSIRDPELVAAAVAHALGLLDTRDRPITAALRAHLATKRSLLVLDNFEHVLAAAPLVGDLLAACPRLAVLVTSRARLRLSGERVFPVPPLTLPGGSETAPVADLLAADAVSLFVARAEGTDPNFALTPENARAVVALCRRLDGLPLAIELAAARTNVLRPAALLARLSRRLPLLAGGPRDLPARQQTLRAAIAWSHDLLCPGEQVLFRRLAVFAGGCALEAAEAVAGGPGTDGTEVLEGITSLVENSLLRGEDGPAGEPRFAMLETVREFALERLAESGEADDVRGRHAAWCLAFAERAETGLTGDGGDRWLDRLEAELDNLRAALTWLLERGDGEAGLRLASAPWFFWEARGGLAEGRSWLERALAATAVETDIATVSERARALGLLGWIASNQGDFGLANRLQDNLARSRERGDARGAALSLFALADAASERNERERAVGLFSQALPLFREIGDRVHEAMTLLCLGAVARRQGDEDRAVAHLEQGMDASRAIGFALGTAVALNNLGRIARRRGEDARATDLYRESLALCWGLRDRWAVAYVLIELASLAAARGQPERAARLFGAAETLREAVGVPVVPSGAQMVGTDYATTVATVRAQLGEGSFAAAWAAGRALPLEQVVAEAAEATSDRQPTAAPSSVAASANDPGLTPRELEVLRLLAAGRTDKEIAAALFISRRTAQGHVAGIFAKLGVNTRTAAAAAALGAGLVPEPVPPS